MVRGRRTYAVRIGDEQIAGRVREAAYAADGAVARGWVLGRKGLLADDQARRLSRGEISGKSRSRSEKNYKDTLHVTNGMQ